MHGFLSLALQGRIASAFGGPRAFLFVWATAVYCGSTPAAAFEADVGKTYGVTAQGIARAVDDARRDFAAHPNDTVILDVGPGRYDLSHAPLADRAVIDVSDIHPGDHGRLVFHGAGPNLTKLVFNKNATWIFGRDVYHISFVGLSMTASQYTVSQGHVVSVAPGAVVLAIEDGFPTPGDLFNPDRSSGRFLRRYTDSANDPHLIETGNEQLPWSSALHVSANMWRIALKNSQFKPDYHPGDFVCIKSKPNGSVYWFLRGNDITFDDVVWSLKSRGAFHGGIGNVHIVNSAIERAPAIKGHVPCLSSPGGGPQIGQPDGPPTAGDIVENNTFDATGDDSIAYFNALGIIRNNTISDSFARGIYLVRSPNVRLENNHLSRCPVLQRSVTRKDRAMGP